MKPMCPNDTNSLFDVYIDGSSLHVPLLETRNDSDLYSIDYTIPAELTSGKRRVAVIFRAPQKREEVVDDTVGETTVEKNNALRITPRIFRCSMQVSS
jgi:hypothetical protein